MNTKVCGISLALLAALSMVFIVTGAATFDAEEGDEDPEEPIYYLDGYVFNIPPQMEREPIAGVTVTLWSSMNLPYAHGDTDLNGYFKIQYDEAVHYISFTIDDFTVKGWSSELKQAGESGLYELDLIDSHTVEGVHHLYDNAGYTAIISRTIGTIFGTVSTEIGNAIVPIEDATVTIVSSSTIMTAETDETGFYTFNCPSGTAYEMTVSAAGFVKWTADGVEPSKQSFNIRLEQKNHEVIFGLDLAHTLELFGLIILLAIAVLTVYLIRKPTSMDGIAVINDLPDVVIEEEHEEDKDN